MPDTWSICAIEEEFNCSYWYALAAKKLSAGTELETKVSESTRPGNRSIDSNVRQRVIEYYEDQENVREMPGKKDVKSVKNPDGSRTQRQKKQLIFNLRELYSNFIDNNPDFRIGFAKFAELRPQHCVLAGAAGTHTVCVCTIHQNLKLMMEGELYFLGFVFYSANLFSA